MAKTPAPAQLPPNAAGIITPEMFAQAQAMAGLGQGAYDPFALGNNIEQGTLYMGMTPGVGHSPFSAPNLAAGQGTDLRLNVPGTKYTKTIRIAGLNLHNGYTADLVTSDPQHQGIITQQEMGHIGVGVEIKDPKGKVIHTEWLDDNDKRVILSPSNVVSDAAKGGPNVPDYMVNINTAQIVQATTGKPGPDTDKTATVEQQLKSIYNLPQPTLEAMKHQLWTAGYYGTKPLNQVDMTTITNDDISAFGTLMLSAARYYKAGQKITWQDLLDKQANSGAVNAAKTAHVRLTDPALIIKEANDTATKILGRGAKPEDVQAILSLVQNNEQGRYAASQASGTPYIQSTDASADIEQYLRQKYPNEANAADWGDRAMQWEQMFKQPSVAPSPIQPNVPGAV